MSDALALLSFGPDGWGDELAAGAWLTIRLALATLPFGLALGLGVALMRDSGNRLLKVPGNVFTTVFRGLGQALERRTGPSVVSNGLLKAGELGERARVTLGGKPRRRPFRTT